MMTDKQKLLYENLAFKAWLAEKATLISCCECGDDSELYNLNDWKEDVYCLNCMRDFHKIDLQREENV